MISTTAKLFIINFAGLAVAAWAAMQPAAQSFLKSGSAHMAAVLVGVFLIGLVSAFRQARKIDAYHSPFSYDTVDSLIVDSGHLEDVREALAMLAVIGTAAGILEAFAKMNEAIASNAGIAQAGAGLLAGTSTAFGSTIVGLSAALLFRVSLRVLETATDRLKS